VTPEEIAWAIMIDLSDRAGVPEWLGDPTDVAAQDVATGVAEIIRAGLSGGSTDGG
jgi:hypothetical protein